jgi:phage tail sheath protein FI
VASLPSATQNKFRLSLDGNPPVTVGLGEQAAADAGALAALIQQTVRALRPLHPSYKNFTCALESDDPADPIKLVLTSGGLPGAGSEVRVEAAPDHDIAAALQLLPNAAVSTPGTNDALQGGLESDFGDEEALEVYIGSRSDREGLFALESIPLFNLLCLPGVTNPSILSDAVGYCQERRAFLIADPPRDKKPDQMVDTASGTALPKSDHAAVYYPWVQIGDPLRGGRPRFCPPSGTIAGLHARTDSSRGVWKAPAGTDATLLGVQNLEYLLTDGENGTLNPIGVNCLRIFPVFGAISWGARTLRGADQMSSEYKYVPVRRLALFIEQSLYIGTQWAVFEPNDEPLWAQLRLAIGAFMQNLFRQGAFQGKTPNEAYFVKCDKETTTQNDINLGIVNIIVGFAPLKPAEFVVIKLQQIAGQIQV